MNNYFYAVCGLLLLIAAITVAALLCRKAAEKYEGLDGVYHDPSRGGDVHFGLDKTRAVHPAVKKNAFYVILQHGRKRMCYSAAQQGRTGVR